VGLTLPGHPRTQTLRTSEALYVSKEKVGEISVAGDNRGEDKIVRPNLVFLPKRIQHWLQMGDSKVKEILSESRVILKKWGG
jgi:hypothetical protein